MTVTRRTLTAAWVLPGRAVLQPMAQDLLGGLVRVVRHLSEGSVEG